MDTTKDVPYIVYEGTEARYERIIKRLIVTLIICVILLFGSNMIWLHYISQYDFESYQYTQDGAGVNVLGDGNGVDYNEPAINHPETATEEPEES